MAAEKTEEGRKKGMKRSMSSVIRGHRVNRSRAGTVALFLVLLVFALFDE